MEVEYLSYKKTNGTDAEQRISPYMRKLSLRWKSIRSIDLSQFSVCKMLEELDLERNELEELDLNGLAYRERLKKLNLERNQLKELDLSGLASCTALQKLNLRWNKFRYLDLSPLAKLKELRWLDLGKNKLEELDLNPLASCPNLYSLNIQSNQLKGLDISPLSSCSDLKWLTLDRNQLTRIDLSPLSSCTKLQTINVSWNEIKDIDLSPISSCRKLTSLHIQQDTLNRTELFPLSSCSKLRSFRLRKKSSIRFPAVGSTLLSEETVEDHIDFPERVSRRLRHYDTPVLVSSLRSVQQLYPVVQKYETEAWKTLHLAQCLVRALCPPEIGFIDITPSTFNRIMKEKNPGKMRVSLIELYCRQIDQKGTTIGTDAEMMAKSSSGELVKRTPEVLELRKKEMESFAGRIRIEILGSKRNDHSSIDLKPLYLIAYGFEILTALGCGLMCYLKDFEGVSEAFEQIGLPLSLTEEEVTLPPEIHMSDAMKEWIWRLVGRPDKYRYYL